MCDQIEERLKKARLEDHQRRKQLLEADEKLRTRAAAQDTIMKDYLERLVEEEVILWARSTMDTDIPSLGADALSWLMDISRRRILALRPGVLSRSSSSTKTAMTDSNALCPSSSRPTSESNCTNVSAISSSKAMPATCVNVKVVEFMREFGQRVESVEFVPCAGEAELRTIVHLAPLSLADTENEVSDV